MAHPYGVAAFTEAPDAALAAVARARHGVFTRAEALERGMTRRMIERRLDSGRLESVHRGVYRIGGAPITKRQALAAACLAGGDHAAISHLAAACVWEFDGIRYPGIDLSIPRARRAHLTGVRVHRVADLSAVDVTTVDAIVVTTPVRTAIDIAPLVPKAVLARALDDAIRRRIVTIPRLRARLGELARRGRDGIGVLRAVIAERTDDDDSRFAMLLGRVIARAGLPCPTPQYRVRLNKRILARVDFAYPDLRLAIEADSYRWHSGRARWATDLERRNVLTLLGWRIIHVTHDELDTRPHDVAARIGLALAGTALPAI